MEIELKTVDGTLFSSHDQEILLVELIKIDREGSRLKLHLSCQLLVLQNLHLFRPTQSNCNQLIFWLMGVTCCQTIWSWIFGLTNVNSLNELSCREIIGLNNIGMKKTKGNFEFVQKHRLKRLIWNANLNVRICRIRVDVKLLNCTFNVVYQINDFIEQLI